MSELDLERLKSEADFDHRCGLVMITEADFDALLAAAEERDRLRAALEAEHGSD